MIKVNDEMIIVWTAVGSVVVGGILAIGAFAWREFGVRRIREKSKKMVYCKCTRCQRPIVAGDLVTLRGPWGRDEIAPKGTTWYYDTEEGFKFAVGCADPECATGNIRKGKCIMAKNGALFIVEC